MSQFYDLSNNANKLRKSYVNGFLDVSGNVLIRNNKTLGFYEGTDQSLPDFEIDANGLKVYTLDAQGNHASQVDISFATIAHLVDVTENVNTNLVNLKNKTDIFDASFNALLGNSTGNVTVKLSNLDASLNLVDTNFTSRLDGLDLSSNGLATSVSSNTGSITLIDASLNVVDNRLDTLDTSINSLTTTSTSLDNRMTAIEGSTLTTDQPLTFTDSATFNTPTTFNSNLVNNGFINQV
tara:strand:+ start:414 stop:1127 length:714 start_codon:yes stop_codon:yes gene_type:complete